MALDAHRVAVDPEILTGLDDRVKYDGVQFLNGKDDAPDALLSRIFIDTFQRFFEEMPEDLACAQEFSVERGIILPLHQKQKLIDDRTLPQKRGLIGLTADEPLIGAFSFADGILDQIRILLVREQHVHRLFLPFLEVGDPAVVPCQIVSDDQSFTHCLNSSFSICSRNSMPESASETARSSPSEIFRSRFVRSS